MKPFVTHSEVPQLQQVSMKKKIFVTGIAPQCDKVSLSRFFSQFGAVDKAFAMYNHKTGESRGFGFIEFEKEETVSRVVGKSFVIDGKEVEVSKAVQKIRGVGIGLSRNKLKKSVSKKPEEMYLKKSLLL